MTKENTAQSRAEENALPEWVREMHEFFRDNGCYRSEDVQRVLGNPSECVTLPATTDLNQLARNR